VLLGQPVPWVRLDRPPNRIKKKGQAELGYGDWKAGIVGDGVAGVKAVAMLSRTTAIDRSSHRSADHSGTGALPVPCGSAPTGGTLARVSPPNHLRRESSVFSNNPQSQLKNSSVFSMAGAGQGNVGVERETCHEPKIR
jgi:hypothetical protein